MDFREAVQIVTRISIRYPAWGAGELTIAMWAEEILSAGHDLEAETVLGIVIDHCRKHMGDYPPNVSQLQERIHAYKRNMELQRVALPRPEGTIDDAEYSRRVKLLVAVLDKQMTADQAIAEMKR